MRSQVTNRTRTAFHILASVLTALASLNVQAKVESPSVHAGQISKGEIALDGRVDGAVWKRAGAVELTQQSPRPGVPTLFHTTAYVLHDEQTLYIGVVCDDPDPELISTNTLIRDGDQSNDDSMTIVLDTFNTRKSAYVFQVNAVGAMADGLLAPTPTSTSNRNGVDLSWNGIWQAEVHRDSKGWTAVFAIDIHALQFDATAKSWGVNFSRYVARNALVLNWMGTTLDSSVYNLQRAGALTGIDEFSKGSGVDFRPYALAARRTSEGSGSKAGVDLKYNVTPSVAGLLTYKTDFSEAEPDQQMINTTRFALSFPETRQFFLEGSNLFTFGYNLSGKAGTTFIPYQSRRIGLVRGITVPMEEGVKVLGQSSAGSVGFIGVRTGNSGVSKATDMFVGRGTYNIGQNLQVGTLITRGDPLGLRSNTLYGTDALWRTSSFLGNKNLNLSAWGARAAGELPSGSAGGYGAGVDYPNDLWQVVANFNVYGAALDPALGFLPRPGTRQYFLELNYKPRPKSSAFDWIRQFFWHGKYSQVDDIKGGKQSSELQFFPNFDTTGGYHYEFDFYAAYDAPSRIFKISPDVSIPVGKYQWDYYGFRFNTPKFKPLVLLLSEYRGGYYNGTMDHPKAEVDVNLFSGRLQLVTSHELFFAKLPQGNLYQRLSIFGGTYSFSRNFYITTLAQKSSVLDGISLYAQAHWLIGSTRNIYLIWSRGVATEVGSRGVPIVAPGSNVALKVQWDFL